MSRVPAAEVVEKVFEGEETPGGALRRWRKLALRESGPMSLASLAALAGLAPSQLSRIEKDRERMPLDDRILTIADTIEIPRECLIAVVLAQYCTRPNAETLRFVLGNLLCKSLIKSLGKSTTTFRVHLRGADRRGFLRSIGAYFEQEDFNIDRLSHNIVSLDDGQKEPRHELHLWMTVRHEGKAGTTPTAKQLKEGLEEALGRDHFNFHTAHCEQI